MKGNMTGANKGRVLCAGLLLGAAALAWSPAVWGQASQPGSTGQYLRGRVTAVGTTTIQIDTKDYPLDPAVRIRDGKGHPRELKDITPGAPVRFHLNEMRLDAIILINSPG